MLLEFVNVEDRTNASYLILKLFLKLVNLRRGKCMCRLPGLCDVQIVVHFLNLTLVFATK